MFCTNFCYVSVLGTVLNVFCWIVSHVSSLHTVFHVFFWILCIILFVFFFIFCCVSVLRTVLNVCVRFSVTLVVATLFCMGSV